MNVFTTVAYGLVMGLIVWGDFGLKTGSLLIGVLVWAQLWLGRLAAALEKKAEGV